MNILKNIYRYVRLHHLEVWDGDRSPGCETSVSLDGACESGKERGEVVFLFPAAPFSIVLIQIVLAVEEKYSSFSQKRHCRFPARDGTTTLKVDSIDMVFLRKSNGDEQYSLFYSVAAFWLAKRRSYKQLTRRRVTT